MNLQVWIKKKSTNSCYDEHIIVWLKSRRYLIISILIIVLCGCVCLLLSINLNSTIRIYANAVGNICQFRWLDNVMSSPMNVSITCLINLLLRQHFCILKRSNINIPRFVFFLNCNLCFITNSNRCTWFVGKIMSCMVSNRWTERERMQFYGNTFRLRKAKQLVKMSSV